MSQNEEVSNWKAYYEKTRETLTRQIGALHQIESRSEEEQNLATAWTRKLYEHVREHLEMLDKTRNYLTETNKRINTLDKRLNLLEAESTEQAKARRIRDLE